MGFRVKSQVLELYKSSETAVPRYK